MNNKATRDTGLGMSLGTIHWQSAKVPVLNEHQLSFLKISIRVLGKLIHWKLEVYTNPQPFLKKAVVQLVNPKYSTSQQNKSSLKNEKQTYHHNFSTTVHPADLSC